MYDRCFYNSDIQNLVKIGLHVVLYEGDLFKENFKETPFKRFMIEMYDLQKPKNEDNDVMENFVKDLMNSSNCRINRKYIYGTIEFKTETCLLDE